MAEEAKISIQNLGGGVQLATITPPAMTELPLVVSEERAEAAKAKPVTGVHPPGFTGRVWEGTPRDGQVVRYRRSWEATERLFDVSISKNGVMVQGHSGSMNKQAVMELIDCLRLAAINLDDLQGVPPPPPFEEQFRDDGIYGDGVPARGKN